MPEIWCTDRDPRADHECVKIRKESSTVFEKFNVKVARHLKFH